MGEGPPGEILSHVGNTPLVFLPRVSPGRVRIYAKLEGQNPTGSLKDRIALAMVEEAEASGRLRPGATLLEPTSGNTGISLALVAKIKGYRLVCVMPENVSEERRLLLEAFGADVVLSPAERGTNGSIEMAMKMVEADPSLIMLYQYGNPANPMAHYRGTGAEILRDLPDVDVFVAGLGTGGTLMGVGRRLKEANPRVQVVAAEPEYGEVVYGLRSLEEGFIPPILDISLLDRRVKVSSRDALAATRLLLEREGIFAGISSGAVLHVALRIASEMEEGNICCLFADGGWKYLSTRAWVGSLEEAATRLEKMIWA